MSGPNQTVHTQSQSDARGSAGSFSCSTAGEGAGVKGAGGNSAGAVKTAGGDVYAGADGNVYKKTDSGWQRYDNGACNPVQKPANTPQKPTTMPQRAPTETTPARPQGQANTSAGAARQTAAPGMQRPTQLDHDHQARFGGFQRQQQYGAAREGGFGGAAAGRFRR